MSDLPEPEQTGPSPRQVLAVLAALVIGIAIGAFVIQNTEKTKVDWLWFHVKAPLWIVVVVVMLASVVLGEIVGIGLRRRRARRER